MRGFREKASNEGASSNRITLSSADLPSFRNTKYIKKPARHKHCSGLLTTDARICVGPIEYVGCGVVISVHRYAGN